MFFHRESPAFQRHQSAGSQATPLRHEAARLAFCFGVSAAGVWELRHAVTAYDAAYIALAEALGIPMITADARLARAPGIACAIEVIGGAEG